MFPYFLETFLFGIFSTFLVLESIERKSLGMIIRKNIRPSDPSSLKYKQDHVEQVTLIRDRAQNEYTKLQYQKQFFHRMQNRVS